MDHEDAARLATLPGAAHLDGGFLRRLGALRDGDPARPRILREVADVLDVFIARDLLQFVFVPPPEDESGAEPGTIDLIAPAREPEPQIAWFTVDEASYDEYRDAVTLVGDLADLLNPPLVLDVADEEE